MTLHVHGFGHFHPENEITNRFLEELDIGATNASILEHVGIRSRRTVLPLDYIRTTHNRDTREASDAALYRNAEMGRRAADLAIDRAGITHSDIGLVVAGGTAAANYALAEACKVAAALGLDVPALDVNAAGASFLAGAHLLSQMRLPALPDFVLLVAPESVTKTVDYSDGSTAVLWGDGAAAAVVSSRIPGISHIVASTFDTLSRETDSHCEHFTKAGRAVQTSAARQTIRRVAQLRSDHGDPERRFHFVGPQENLRDLETVCRELDIPDGYQHSNIEWYGNTGAAGAASVVSMRWEKWRCDDVVAVVGLGGSLSFSSHVLRFDVL